MDDCGDVAPCVLILKGQPEEIRASESMIYIADRITFYGASNMGKHVLSYQRASLMNVYRCIVD